MDGQTNSSVDEVCGGVTVTIFTCWLGIYVLFLPLFVFVLVTGYRRWAFDSTTVTHSDLFTLNIVTIEILNIVASCVYLYGRYSTDFTVMFISENFIFMSIVGQMYFHDLTCLERYLAVLHPVTYLHFKKGGGVMIRNASIVVAWLASFIVLLIQSFKLYQVVYLVALAALSGLFACFCTASVLHALIRPRPGDRKRFDQSKRMALYTMAAILGALLSKFLFVFLTYVSLFIERVGVDMMCILSASVFWMTLPSSLVLPLLFLHRAGKLPMCK